MTELTQENYYKTSPKEFMSASTFKQMMQNEAAFMASINDGYSLFKDPTPLLVGNYLHSYFESTEAHQSFISEHPEMLSSRGKTKGQLKTEYLKAQQMIDRIEEDPLLMALINSAQKREVIVSGNIDNVLWKGKVDALNVEDGIFLDFKTVRTLKNDGEEWADSGAERVKYDNFVEARNYHVQMYVYKTLLEQMYGKEFDPVIIAVSKEDEPLADAYRLSDDLLSRGKALVDTYQHRFVDVLNGKLDPISPEDHSRYFNSTYRVDDIKIL